MTLIAAAQVHDLTLGDGDWVAWLLLVLAGALAIINGRQWYRHRR